MKKQEPVLANVRHFRAQLAFYLMRVEDGKTVVITSRGKPVAHLTAPPKPPLRKAP